MNRETSALESLEMIGRLRIAKESGAPYACEICGEGSTDACPDQCHGCGAQSPASIVMRHWADAPRPLS